MLSRRSVLQAAAVVSSTALVHRAARAFVTPDVAVSLQLRSAQPGVALPSDFMGLGYEMSSAARLGLLSQSNAPYVRLVRNLGPSGVLRLGGIVADYTTYAAEGEAVAEPHNTVLTRRSLQQLRGFLDAVGWSALWSLNFGRGTLDEAVAEAKAVASVLGTRLLAVELGNEVENYGKGREPRRVPPYAFETFRAEFSRWHAALTAAVPGLRFAAPDTASSIEWVERMAADARAEVQLLTTHYYRGDQKLGTPEQLLQPDPALAANLARLHQASLASGLPWRMCETNSFFGGGRPGLSDTLAGALWTLDFLLLLAQAGCAGVNVETGVNQLGFLSSYSPVRDDESNHATAGVPYYGMLAFAEATAGARTVLPLELTASQGAFTSALTAYALGDGARLRSLVLINKSATRAARFRLGGLPLRAASLLRLTGPSLESKEGVTLGGVRVDAGGRWVAPWP